MKAMGNREEIRIQRTEDRMKTRIFHLSADIFSYKSLITNHKSLIKRPGVRGEG